MDVSEGGDDVGEDGVELVVRQAMTAVEEGGEGKGHVREFEDQALFLVSEDVGKLDDGRVAAEGLEDADFTLRVVRLQVGAVGYNDFQGLVTGAVDFGRKSLGDGDAVGVRADAGASNAFVRWCRMVGGIWGSGCDWLAGGQIFLLGRC